MSHTNRLSMGLLVFTVVGLVSCSNLEQLHLRDGSRRTLVTPLLLMVREQYGESGFCEYAVWEDGLCVAGRQRSLYFFSTISKQSVDTLIEQVTIARDKGELPPSSWVGHLKGSSTILMANTKNDSVERVHDWREDKIRELRGIQAKQPLMLLINDLKRRIEDLVGST